MKEKSAMQSGENANNMTFCIPYLDYVSRDVVLDETTKTLIAENCQRVTFAKGDHLLQAGSVCQYVYFILEGECISYFTDFKGKTTTWFFHFNTPESSVKNIFAVDHKSFLLQQPATLSIETLSPVTAIRFSAQAVNTLIEQSPAMERWLRLINERAFVAVYDRIDTLLNLSAADRYRKFLKNEPHLLNMFSNYLIATYLHVAPQSLSRIRKNLKPD